MEGDCMALHKAVYICLDVRKSMYNLVCMAHRPRGTSYHIASGHTEPMIDQYLKFWSTPAELVG